MPFANQQHLAPNDLAMLQLALARVEETLRFKRLTPESNHVAAMMVAEFQRGTHTEDAMVDVFLGKRFPSVSSPGYSKRTVKNRRPKKRFLSTVTSYRPLISGTAASLISLPGRIGGALPPNIRC